MTTAIIAKRKHTQRTEIFARYQPFFRNNISLLNKARSGLQPQAVLDFMDVSNLSAAAIESAFNKSMKTFQNYLNKKINLDIATSEKLLKLFALYSRGIEVFGSVDAFSEWLSRPAYGLGKKVPLQILDTITGVDLVNEELLRIEYGDLA